jgi:hypothetical protein
MMKFFSAIKTAFVFLGTHRMLPERVVDWLIRVFGLKGC